MDPDGLSVFAIWPHAHILGDIILNFDLISNSLN